MPALTAKIVPCMFRIMVGLVRVDADGGVPDDPACVPID
jgi:hypothetical protein